MPLRMVHASKLAEEMAYFITTLPTANFAVSSSANKGPFIWLQAFLNFIIFKYFTLTQHIYSRFKETALIEDKIVTPVLCKNLHQASFNHPLKKNNGSLAFFLEANRSNLSTPLKAVNFRKLLFMDCSCPDESSTFITTSSINLFPLMYTVYEDGKLVFTHLKGCHFLG